MLLMRRIRVGVVGVALVIAAAACGPALVGEAQPSSGSQALATVLKTPAPQQPGDVVWGRVPYCNCLTGSATANVASALLNANLAVTLKELSPRDGWLYFVATFDPRTATPDQVGAAMVAGGAEVIEGPP